jgi:hypothetical protein
MKETLDLRDRRQKTRALRASERCKHARGNSVGPFVEHLSLGESTLRQNGAPYSAIVRADANADEFLALQRSEETADVPGVEPETPAKISHVGSVWPDLPQQARFAERPCASEEVILECADSLGDGAIESPNLFDCRVCHDI